MPVGVLVMNKLEWENTKATWVSRHGKEFDSKRLSHRKTFPEKLVDDIEKKYYTLIGWNYLGEGFYVEGWWPKSHHAN